MVPAYDGLDSPSTAGCWLLLHLDGAYGIESSFFVFVGLGILRRPKKIEWIHRLVADVWAHSRLGIDKSTGHPGFVPRECRRGGGITVELMDPFDECPSGSFNPVNFLVRTVYDKGWIRTAGIDGRVKDLTEV